MTTEQKLEAIVEVFASHGVLEKYYGPEAEELAPYFDKLKDEVRKILEPCGRLAWASVGVM